MNRLKHTSSAIVLGAALALGSVPVQAGKIPAGVGAKVAKIFKSTPRSAPKQNGGVIFGADTATRISHLVYASMSVAELKALDEKGMDKMAYQYYLTEQSKAESTGTLLDPEKNETAYRVQQITRKILKAIRENPELSPRYNQIKDQITEGSGWKIMTIQSPTLNAYCLPGGRMVVYSGLAENLSNDQLAIVIGHEIMHAMKGHSYQTAKDHLMRQAAIFLGAAATGAKSFPVSMAVLGEAFTTSTVFSRQHEKEADITGLHVARDAGYDPRAALSLWQKMESMQKGRQLPEFFSSHPSHGTREAYLREELDKMK